MTETEWLAATDPQPMLEFLRDKASDRKLRLFAVACCRRIWHLLPDKRSRTAVDVAERYADGIAGEEEIRLAEFAADDAWMAPPEQFSDAHKEAAFLPYAALNPNTNEAAKIISSVAVTSREYSLEDEAEPSAQTALLRDLIGNPFRPVKADPAWLTSTVVQLAERIYRERAFDQMPILADALQDAGCDNAEILAHCRGSGPHVRGCWLLDLLLGKS